MSHLCVDGALCTVMTDLCTLHHAKALSDVGSSMVGEGRGREGSFKPLKLCSWFVSVGRCNHASHHGFEWPLKDEIGNDHLMKCIRAMIKSCSPTTASLAAYRERAIASRLVFLDWAFDGSYTDRPCIHCVRSDRHFADSSHGLQHLVRRRPSCDGCSLSESVDFFQWVTIGHSSRSFLGVLLDGIGNLVAFAIQHGHSTYHLWKFGTLSLRLQLLGSSAMLG